MKANQRKTFNRLKAALKEGRKKALPTYGDIYTSHYDYTKREEVVSACAFGAMALGLGVSESIVSTNANSLIFPAMANILGVDKECISRIYGPIYRANDTALTGEQDNAALNGLIEYLDAHPEVC